MVESLLDVLLQTLLSIMSKSHSVETSRGQRCPQCTAEITVRARTTTRFLFPSAASTSTTSEHAPACVCCFFSPSLAQGEYVSCLLSLLQQMTEIHFHHLLNNFHSKEELKVRSSCAAPADALGHCGLDS